MPGEFHGHRSLVDYSPGGHKELDMAEQLTHLASFYGTEECSLWTRDMSIDRLCHAGRMYSWEQVVGKKGSSGLLFFHRTAARRNLVLAATASEGRCVS